MGKDAETFDAETDYDDYIDRIFTFINEKVGTEYFPSYEDEEEVARFKKDFNDEFDEVGQAIEDMNTRLSAESHRDSKGRFAYEVVQVFPDGYEQLVSKTDTLDDAKKDIEAFPHKWRHYGPLEIKKRDKKMNAEYHRDSKGRFAEKPILTGSVIGGLALGLMYFMGRK